MSSHSAISGASSQWLEALFASIDQMQSAQYAAFFEEDGEFRFANHLPAKGREQIAQVAQMVFDQLDRISHRVLRVWEQDATLLVEGEVSYWRKGDGKCFQFPFFSCFEFGSERLLKNYRAYVDAHELFESS